MRINCSDTGKRYNRDWIFRHFNYTFEQGSHYAITGPNGSGKSTLLQVIAGATASSEGKINYTSSHQPPATSHLEGDLAYRQLSIAAPYLELIEEMTITEFLQFHSSFKPLMKGVSVKDAIGIITLEKSANKQIRYYSSGMKQRVKLAQAIFSDVSCVLLDEPCTNLDEAGIALYHQLVKDYCSERTVIVSSNDKVEYHFCKDILSILDYK